MKGVEIPGRMRNLLGGFHRDLLDQAPNSVHALEWTDRLRTKGADTRDSAHADPGVSAGDPFGQRFPWFVDHWGGNPDFTCVIGFDGDEVIGFA